MLNFTIEQQFFVDLLRSRLSMRTQLASGSNYRVPGQLGNDELWEDFRMGLNFFNTYPPIITTFTSTDLFAGAANPTLETPSSVLSTPVMVCA